MYTLHKLKCFVLYCCFITGNHCRKKLQGLTNMQQGRCYGQWKMQTVKDAVGPPTITQRNRRSPHSSHFPRNKQTRTHARTHTHLTALCPGLPGWVGTREVKPIWILLKQETVSGCGISWAIASLHLTPDRQPRQHPTTLFFTGRIPFLPPNQQRQSTEGTSQESWS